MSVGFTIPMARALLATGRAPEVARMLEPLLAQHADEPDVLARPDEVVVRSLLARIRLLNENDAARARQVLEPVASFRLSDVPREARAEASLWLGWCDLMADEPSLPSAALHLAVAATSAGPNGAPETLLWSCIGRARLAQAYGLDQLSAHFAHRACLIQEAIRSAEAEHLLRTLSVGVPPVQPGMTGVIGIDPAMQRVLVLATLAARQRISLLIQGESGSGRRHLARAISVNGDRADQAFHVIRPGSENGFLGNVLERAPDARAALTTVCLHDVEQLPVPLQRTAAAAAADGRLRLICTTTRDVTTLLDGDLVERRLLEACSLLQITLPPLRKRPEDVELLVRHFLQVLQAPGDLPAAVTDDALHLLRRYAWPGNVRQLRNEIERALVHVQSEPAPVIRASVLSADVRGSDSLDEAATHEEVDLDRILSQTEKVVIESALAQHCGQVAASADALGLTRQGLYKKMKRLGVDPARFQNGRDEQRHLLDVPEESQYG